MWSHGLIVKNPHAVGIELLEQEGRRRPCQRHIKPLRHRAVSVGRRIEHLCRAVVIGDAIRLLRDGTALSVDLHADAPRAARLQYFVQLGLLPQKWLHEEQVAGHGQRHAREDDEPRSRPLAHAAAPTAMSVTSALYASAMSPVVNDTVRAAVRSKPAARLIAPACDVVIVSISSTIGRASS